MIPIRLISAISGQVHLIEPTKASAIMSVLSSDTRAGVDWEEGAGRAMANTEGYKPYRVVNGAAVVPVVGTLMHQMESIRPSSGSTGYDGLRCSLQFALNDDDVQSVIFEIDSPGGMVTGLDEIASLIRSASKPTAAYIDAMAFSAAYYLASQADYIVATPSAEVGSIGSLILHTDRSAQAEQHGLSYTIIHSGEHKVEGNSLEPLSNEAKTKMQARVDRARNEFARAVGRGRGSRFSEQDAILTEAETYHADEALAMGMIDAIAPPESALSVISELLASAGENPGGGPMALDTAGNAARADATADAEKIKLEAHASGVEDERGRMSAILNHPKADANFAVAKAAVTSGLTVEQAGAMLNAQPEAAAIEAVAEAPEAEASIDVAAIATASANAAVAALMDKADGTGVEHGGEDAVNGSAIEESAIMEV